MDRGAEHRLLLVSSVPTSREVVEEALQSQGIEAFVRSVRDGSDFRSALEERWDVVIASPDVVGLPLARVAAMVGALEHAPPLVLWLRRERGERLDEEMLTNAMAWRVRDVLEDDRVERLALLVAHARANARERSSDVRALTHARAHARDLLSALPVPAALVDHELVIERANPAFFEMLSVPPDVVGLPLTGLGAGAWRSAEVERAFESLLDGAESVGPVTMVLGVGSLDRRSLALFGRWVEGPISGQPNRILVSLLDQTRESLLLEHMSRVQHLEAIGRLASGSVVDLRNLLSVIRSSVSVLQTSPWTHEPPPQLTGLSSAAGMATELVSRLVSFTRPGDADFDEVCLSEVVEEAMPLIEATLDPSITLSLDLAPDLPSVWGSAEQCTHALAHVVLNARDAMPSGGRLTVATSEVHLDRAPDSTSAVRVRPGRYVLLEVTDTGCGMSSQLRQRAFDPLVSTKREHGTGLGLASVYNTVKEAQGYVFLDSAPGQGTAVRIYLPVYSPSQGLTESAAPSPPATPSPGADGRVLLVEDDPLIRVAVEGVLRRNGYQVRAVPTFRAALEVAESGERVDLALLDAVLPDGSGAELLSVLEARMPGVRVLFVSGYEPEDLGLAGIEERHFLRKPFAPSKLLFHVQQVMGHRARQVFAD